MEENTIKAWRIGLKSCSIHKNYFLESLKSK
jgi:hypothetical protein